MKLEDKVALVTGAGRGIGRGIAEVLADEGAHVVVNDLPSGRDAAEETARAIRAKGRRALVVEADVANRPQMEAMIDQAWTNLGPIDILVNNAGIETIVPFLDLTDEQWTRLTDVNLRGEWLCSQVFCRRAVAEKRQGSIVNIGSIQAAKGRFPSAAQASRAKSEPSSPSSPRTKRATSPGSRSMWTGAGLGSRCARIPARAGF